LWDFFISFLILVVMMGWYKFVPGWQILLLHFFVAIAFLVSLGPGLWITALNVKYRDFRLVTLFLVKVGIYISPIGFSSNVVPDQWRLLYPLNPMIGVIDGFRWCILAEESQLYLPGFGLSIAVTAFFLWFGVRQFRKMEKSFVDII
jgi:lipopolysaccharide transport system permease protein